MTQVLCAYGDCTEEMPSGKGFKLTISSSFNGTKTDQQSFCCYEHGWRWLKNRDDKINHNHNVKEPITA